MMFGMPVAPSDLEDCTLCAGLGPSSHQGYLLTVFIWLGEHDSVSLNPDFRSEGGRADQHQQRSIQMPDDDGNRGWWRSPLNALMVSAAVIVGMIVIGTAVVLWFIF
ncbi:hypothetical protein [Roseomonas marmotae]|uniref:Uncharacterized protein n=1 Tax=Roseomonas marmotae TaxID=2768161 RepID=A0ABS3KIN2_9PROT|nr:hypothetical protein [Roseomonas marmotae]MBO1077324.1 hypothetical protein [Roseomonas marmotae]